jgi:hypothetical protein
MVMTRKALPNPKTTEKIEQVAIQLGASSGQIYQWRRRGVSAAWRIKIVQASSGKVKLTDFPEVI